MQILFSFSVFLEAVAVIPQLYVISRTGEAETITCHYLIALGVYRTLALVDWMYRFYVEYSYDIIALVAGFMQTGFYLDLLYLYLCKTKSEEQVNFTHVAVFNAPPHPLFFTCTA